MLPVLLLITFRPEFEPPWSGLAHVRVLKPSFVRHAQVRGRYQIQLRPVTGLPFVGHHFSADNSRTDTRRLFAGAMSAHAYDTKGPRLCRIDIKLRGAHLCRPA